MNETKPRALTVRLDPETLRQFRAMAGSRDQSMQELAAEAIREKIEREKEKER